MNFLFLIIPLLAFANPECRRPCEQESSPHVPDDIREIREHVTGECTEVSEIVVTPPQPDDPCTSANIDKALFHSSSGGELYWSARLDRNYKPGGQCRGNVMNNLCYIRSNSVYSPGGAASWRKDPETGGLVLELKREAGCKNEACAFPFEPAQTSIGVEYDDIYDVQQKKDAIIECRPENCYSIKINANYQTTPGGLQLHNQIVTVTRMKDGSLKTRLYVNNTDSYTSPVTVDGIIGENNVKPELIGKKIDTFVSCTEQFSERRASYFPARKK